MRGGFAVLRKIGRQRQGAAFDLTAIRRGEVTDRQIYPDDIVVLTVLRSRQRRRGCFKHCHLYLSSDRSSADKLHASSFHYANPEIAQAPAKKASLS